jgi:hypothetical protein
MPSTGNACTKPSSGNASPFLRQSVIRTAVQCRRSNRPTQLPCITALRFGCSLFLRLSVIRTAVRRTESSRSIQLILLIANLRSVASFANNLLCSHVCCRNHLFLLSTTSKLSTLTLTYEVPTVSSPPSVCKPYSQDIAEKFSSSFLSLCVNLDLFLLLLCRDEV